MNKKLDNLCGSINHEGLGILNSKRMLFQERFHPIVGTLVGISESQGRNHKRKVKNVDHDSKKKKKSIWMSILHSTDLNVGVSGLTNTFNHKG